MTISKPCNCHLHRRRFLTLAGAALFAPSAAFAQESGEIETLLLICNEPRVWQNANNWLKTRDLAGKYKPVEVEGAAIGLVSDQYQASRATSWDAVISTVTSQKLRRVIALDHRGCAAMKAAYGFNKTTDKLIETETHRYALQEFRKKLTERNAELEVEIGLIGLDGKVEIFKS